MLEAIENLMRFGKWEEAAFECDARLQLQPTAAKLHAYKGMCFFRMGNFAEAEPCFRRAYILEPSLLDAGIKQAQCLEKLKRYKESMQIAHEIQPLRPNDSALRNLLEYLETRYEAVEHERWEATRRIEFETIETEGYASH